MSLKLRVLVAVHLALSVLPLADPTPHVIPTGSEWLVMVSVGVFSVLFGQLMLLAFWAGQGTTGRGWRITGTIAGTGYVAFWLTAGNLISRGDAPDSSWIDWLQGFGTTFLMGGLLVVFFSGGYLIMRRWYFHLDRDADASEPSPSSRYQFLIHILLVVVTMTSMFLHGRRSDFPSGQWKGFVGDSMWMGVFFVNSIYAARATLSQGPIRWQLFVVLVVAVLAGTGTTLITTRHITHLWEGPINGVITTVPTLVMILSLLVVRSCGYRLVPNPPARNPAA